MNVDDTLGMMCRKGKLEMVQGVLERWDEETRKFRINKCSVGDENFEC